MTDEEKIEGKNETDTAATVGHGGYGVEKDSFYKTEPTKQQKFAKMVLYTFLSSLVYSLAFHYFVTPCMFAPGGIGGLVAMLKFAIGKYVPSGIGFDYTPFVITFLNVPVLILAYKGLSKEFAINTAFTVIFMTAIMLITDNLIDPSYTISITGKVLEEDVGIRLVSAIIGGAFCGVSLAFALKVNSSTGGADVIGAVLQKKNPHKSVATMIFAANGVILIGSIPVYQDNLMPVFLSVIYIFVSSYVCDRILQGSKTGLKFEVITEHAEEISAEIIKKLGHGVTITPAKGMFEHREKSLLICIIKPRQIARFQEIISHYSETFAYVGQVNEIIGKFNSGSKFDRI